MNCGGFYWKKVCLNESSTNLREVKEQITQTSATTENIATSMCFWDRSYHFCVDNSKILSVCSGGTARYATNVTLTNACDLAHKWYVDSVTSGITGAFTSANNGLCSSGQVVSLGGTLTGDTTIDGAHTFTAGTGLVTVGTGGITSTGHISGAGARFSGDLRQRVGFYISSDSASVPTGYTRAQKTTQLLAGGVAMLSCKSGQITPRLPTARSSGCNLSSS